VYPRSVQFGNSQRQRRITNFAGGRITSDAGIVLMAELEKKLRITARFAKCFREHRNLSYVDYSVHELLAQGVYGIVLGYEDVNDQDKLRYDPALALALGRLDFIDSNAALLAGKAQLID
jgi:hypothetical protein